MTKESDTKRFLEVLRHYHIQREIPSSQRNSKVLSSPAEFIGAMDEETARFIRCYHPVGRQVPSLLPDSNHCDSGSALRAHNPARIKSFEERYHVRTYGELLRRE